MIDLEYMMHRASQDDGEGWRIALIVCGELGRRTTEKNDLRLELDDLRLKWAAEVAMRLNPGVAGATRAAINEVLAKEYGQHVADRIYPKDDP